MAGFALVLSLLLRGERRGRLGLLELVFHGSKFASVEVYGWCFGKAPRKAPFCMGHSQMLELAPVVLEDILQAEERPDVAWAVDLLNAASPGGTGDEYQSRGYRSFLLTASGS